MLAVIFTFTFMACSRARPSPANGEVMQAFGSSQSPDKRLALAVTKRSVSLVVFTLTSVADGHLVFSEEIGSDAMRWCFYWDEQNRLWAYSSDTGYFSVITVQPDGTVAKAQVTKETRLPKPIHDFLPDSLRRKWGSDQSLRLDPRSTSTSKPSS